MNCLVVKKYVNEEMMGVFGYEEIWDKEMMEVFGYEEIWDKEMMEVFGYEEIWDKEMMEMFGCQQIYDGNVWLSTDTWRNSCGWGSCQETASPSCSGRQPLYCKSVGRPTHFVL